MLSPTPYGDLGGAERAEVWSWKVQRARDHRQLTGALANPDHDPALSSTTTFTALPDRIEGAQQLLQGVGAENPFGCKPGLFAMDSGDGEPREMP